MEWQRRHKRRVKDSYVDTFKKVKKIQRQDPKPSDQRDERVAKVMKRHQDYVNKQRRKAKGKINRDGSIVASDRGDLGCVITALGAGLGLAATALRVKGWL